MDNHSFNIKIRPLNIEYRKIFGEIPRITDYSCSKDKYIAAFEHAIKEKLLLPDVLILRKHQYQDESTSKC